MSRVRQMPLASLRFEPGLFDATAPESFQSSISKFSNVRKHVFLQVRIHWR